MNGRIKESFILVSSLIALVIVSIAAMGVLSYTSSVARNTITMLEKSRQIYYNDFYTKSIFNTALSFAVKDVDNLEYSHLGDHELQVLNEWKTYVERTLPSEKENWISIYNRIISSDSVKNFKNSSSFINFINSLIDDGVLKNLNLSDLETLMFRFRDDGGMIYDLILVKYKNIYHWANIQSKTLNQYLFVTNSERTSSGNPIYYVSGDVIDGPLYTTDEIYIWDYDSDSPPPTFKGKVEAKGINIEPDSLRDPIFENGYSIIDPSEENKFVFDENFANSVFEKYENNTKDIYTISEGDRTGIKLGPDNKDFRITSNVLSNGKCEVLIWKWKKGWWSGKWKKLFSIEYYPTPDLEGYMNATLKNINNGNIINFKFNGIIFSKGDLYISDKDDPSYFCGLITLSSEKNIYIKGNILYSYLKKDNGFITDTSLYNNLSRGHDFDKLNIISYNDVIMRWYVPDNLYITASIYALMGEFTLEDYRFVKKDKLHIFGSISQKYRGPIGTFSASSGFSTGFKKDYIFDQRLYSGPYPLFTPSMKGRVSVVDIR